jgi:hypothetical protein
MAENDNQNDRPHPPGSEYRGKEHGTIAGQQLRVECGMQSSNNGKTFTVKIVIHGEGHLQVPDVAEGLATGMKHALQKLIEDHPK